MADNNKISKFIPAIIILGVLSIILENGLSRGPLTGLFVDLIDHLVIILFAVEFIVDLVKAEYKLIFLRRNALNLFFLLVFSILFVYVKYFARALVGHDQLQYLSAKTVFLISVFNIFKVILRIRKLKNFLTNLATHPAQTIMVSFLVVILVGTLLLMMPFATADRNPIGFINAVFTATSATCVTGLIVVDTATRFSFPGQLIIMLLIQIGGLGIMIMSAFAGFIMRKKMSLQEKMTISYALNETDMSSLGRSVSRIITITLLFELAGALLLWHEFRNIIAGDRQAVFFAVFHSISAFCNAGFALFSNSLEQFKSNVFINFTIAGLIICGGISFAVSTNLTQFVKSRLKVKVFKYEDRIINLTLNTKIVAFLTALLIIAGMLIFYAFEHKLNLLPYDLKTGYLSSFFQSVTLRTAGFNTLDISSLHTATYLVMILFMFIGGASGSTAGGIKLNTVGVVYAYIKSILKSQNNIVLLRQSLSRDLVNQAFMIITLSVLAVFTGTLVLVLSEGKQLIQTMFEVVSAFGTVGLSTGLTPFLSSFGKIVIITLMYIGRIGPLTVIMALSRKSIDTHVQYPDAQISIG